MFGNGKKTIGVFVSHANEEHQTNLIKGIISKAKELDYNTAIFVDFCGEGLIGYDNGEIQIVNLPEYEELDGVILATDTIRISQLEEKYKKEFKERCKCPVVSIGKELPDFYNVLVDEYTVLDEIIKHFIDVHKFNRINYLAHPTNSERGKRVAAYRKILTEHNIRFDEDQIYYGLAIDNCAEMAVDYWLDVKKELPQAIVCSNDYMAMGVCKALADRGIVVPNQVAVTGCGDVEYAAEYSPSITTARIPIYEMGIEAVEKIHKHIHDMEQPLNAYMQAVTIYRSSCGCKKHWYHESNERRRNHIQTREVLQMQIYRNAYMSIEFTGLTKLEDLIQKIWTYIEQDQNMAGFCINLFKNWDSYQLNEENNSYQNSEEIIMEAGIKNKSRLAKLKFNKKDLIPTALSEEKPMTFYFSLLHHQDNCFGYVGISYHDIQAYMMTYQAWLINVSNALENIRIHSELNRLVFKLEDMSIRDELTQLYNRRVINTLGKKYLNHCLEEHTYLMIFTADLDKLKYVNDKYGHASGDIAIKTVSDALQKAADDDEICIRLGGDEFMTIGIDYDEGKIEKYVNRFVNELNNFNFKNEYEFDVYVSYGFNLILPKENTTIEDCLIEADARMYKQKYEKNAKNIKANLSTSNM